MTAQDNARIVNRYLFQGKVTTRDREILAAAKTLHQPFGALLKAAVVAKTTKLVEAQVKRSRSKGVTRELREFVTSPVATGFLPDVGEALGRLK